MQWGGWPSVNINHLPISSEKAKYALSSPYPLHLLELWWWGWSAQSCTGATKQLLNESPVFRWHHLWLLQLRCKKWLTAHKGWRNVSALCRATEFRLLIHIGLSALLTPKTSLHHLQSVFGRTVIKDRNFFVCRSNDSRLTLQNLGLKFPLSEGDQCMISCLSNDQAVPAVGVISLQLIPVITWY